MLLHASLCPLLLHASLWWSQLGISNITDGRTQRIRVCSMWALSAATATSAKPALLSHTHPHCCYCCCSAVFAVLEEPHPPAPAPGRTKKWSPRKEDARVAAAEAAAVAASLAASTVVRIRALDGLGASSMCHQVCVV